MGAHRSSAMLLLLVLLLAGCTGATKDRAAPASEHEPGAARWAERALPSGEGHDHRDPAQHKGLSTPNFRVVGWDPMETDYHGRTSGSYFCGEAREDADGRRLSFIHSFWTDVALVVADVTDPNAPEVLGELVLPLTHVYDVAATPDARYVVLATSPLDTGPDQAPEAGVAAAAGAPTFRDACTGETPVVERAPGLDAWAPYDSGVVLVDVADPTKPVIADYRPLPALGAHSVFATHLDGEPVVLASVTNLVHHGSYFAFLRIADTPLGAKLSLESVYRPAAVEDETPIINGHMDGWIHEHPVTGQAIAYLADWDGGLHVVDVENLAAPTLIGRWTDYTFRDGNDGGNLHGAYPLDVTWEGRHYTFVGQEVTRRPRDTPTGLVHVLDTTDPANPQRVGAWTLPVDVEWGGTLMFSTHYFRIVDRTLFVAMYHGGVWAVDVADVTQPRAVGAFIPDHVPPNPPGSDLDQDQYDWAPTVLDLHAYADGDLVVWDGASGVYVVRFNDKSGLPSPEPWPITGL